MAVYSNKQRELVRRWQQGELRRLNILEGSVRSGKTWISLVLWAFWVACSSKDGSYLMCAKTLTALKRNCLDLLQNLVGRSNFDYSIPRKEAVLFGRRIYLEGASDARAEAKIRGMTLQGAYCDELTLFPKEFFTMLLSRLSEPGAKLFATTNPDSPRHWLMTDYLERADELDMLRMFFGIEDNPYLDPVYVQNLMREYVGVFFERFILGRWVVAEGLIYSNFDKQRHLVDKLPTKGQYYISIDYGTVNPCSMGLWCVADDKAYRLREYYHNSRKVGNQRTDEEYYTALGVLAGDLPIRYVVVDPSAASFIECIRRKKLFRVIAADNSVVDGIRYTASLLTADKLCIHSGCKNSIEEFELYRWDDKAGDDRPIKENDHAMDDIRYFCYTVLRRLWRKDKEADDDKEV